MLVGNPDSFAIWCDAVDSWSTDRFKNGCFAYFHRWRTFMLSGLNCLKHSVEDVRLFNLPTSSAYAELVARAFPPMDSDVAHSDYSHLVSIGSLLDDDENVFLVESGEQAKLVFGSRSEMPTSREVILTRGEFQSVVHATIAQLKTS
ncbi:Imm42 family immunity protein [Caballeronia sp. GAFFF2]|uniref:Imm42 family immunity protein n=1 Tax=Caballeronia sp. GAFFF2 TaxID=2921741 RepID=UPI0020282AF5|nr:Imm42 family immunity protein [Caballeronia sp. GAFFF2]